MYLRPLRVYVLQVLRIPKHFAIVARSAAHNEVDRAGEESIEKLLVALREDREACRVGEEDGRWEDEQLDRLCQPLLDCLFRGKVRGDLQRAAEI
mgnify:CR=1 FL=1